MNWAVPCRNSCSSGELWYIFKITHTQVCTDTWIIQKTELEEASVDCFGHGCERYLQTFTNKWLHRELLLHYLIDRTALPGQSAGRISPFGTLLVRGREASLCGSQVASGDELLPA